VVKNFATLFVVVITMVSRCYREEFAPRVARNITHHLGRTATKSPLDSQEAHQAAVGLGATGFGQLARN
jgi:hypothetical protein